MQRWQHFDGARNENDEDMDKALLSYHIVKSNGSYASVRQGDILASFRVRPMSFVFPKYHSAYFESSYAEW